MQLFYTISNCAVLSVNKTLVAEGLLHGFASSSLRKTVLLAIRSYVEAKWPSAVKIPYCIKRQPNSSNGSPWQPAAQEAWGSPYVSFLDVAGFAPTEAPRNSIHPQYTPLYASAYSPVEALRSMPKKALSSREQRQRLLQSAFDSSKVHFRRVIQDLYHE